MKLIKIDECNYTIDKKYRVPNNYELKCWLASKTRPEVYEVDQSFFTDAVTEAEYEIEGDQVRITFPVYDVITEVLIDTHTGNVKVCFDYLPTELEKDTKTEVVKFLVSILKPTIIRYCDATLCRYKHQYAITGTCGKYYWD